MIRAFHCGRYTIRDQQEILARGLKRSCRDFLQKRIRREVDVGEISENLANQLLTKNQSDCPSRTPYIAFVSAEELRNEEAIGWLLSHWGGEALFFSHAYDPVTGPLLRRLGIPCIVELLLPETDVDTYGTWKTTNDVSPDRIVSIHRYGDDRFSEFTNYKTWIECRLDDNSHMQSAWPPH